MALEEKIREYESHGPTSSVDSGRLQRLERENDRLRKLLKCVGIDEGFQRVYLDAPARASALAQRSPLRERPFAGDAAAFDQFLNASETESVQLPIEGSRPDPDRSQESWNPGLNLEAEFMQLNNVQHSSSNMAHPLIPPDDRQENLFPVDVVPLPHQSPNTFPQDTLLEDHTTPCSEAYALLQQYNRKGVNFIELDLKLRGGYRGCSVTECTVDNKLLLSVLAEMA